MLLLDDHLLRDVLASDVRGPLKRLMARHPLATTNLYYLRLCKSAVSARGGQLTGAWAPERRRALAEVLVALPDAIDVVPMRTLAFAVAKLGDNFRLSTLGAEAVAASRHLGATLCVWEGDDGPSIRAAALATKVPYRTIAR